MYQCPRTTSPTTLTTTVASSNSSVLILSTYRSSSVPVLTDLNGSDKTTSFEIESDVVVRNACGVQFKGQLYVYGSHYSDYRQITKVEDCRLKRIGTLPFKFKTGACAATADQLFLCFHINDAQTCHTSNEPDDLFNKIPKSLSVHGAIQIATNDGSSTFSQTTNSFKDIILACGSSGGSTPSHNKCEIYTINENKWKFISQYPFGMRSRAFSLF